MADGTYRRLAWDTPVLPKIDFWVENGANILVLELGRWVATSGILTFDQRKMLRRPSRMC